MGLNMGLDYSDIWLLSSFATTVYQCSGPALQCFVPSYMLLSAVILLQRCSLQKRNSCKMISTIMMIPAAAELLGMGNQGLPDFYFSKETSLESWNLGILGNSSKI